MSAGSAARRCAHVKGEKLAQWPYVGIELKVSFIHNLRQLNPRFWTAIQKFSWRSPWELPTNFPFLFLPLCFALNHPSWSCTLPQTPHPLDCSAGAGVSQQQSPPCVWRKVAVWGALRQPGPSSPAPCHAASAAAACYWQGLCCPAPRTCHSHTTPQSKLLVGVHTQSVSTVTSRWSKPRKSYSHTFINITVLSPQGDPSPWSHTVTHSFISQHCHFKVIQAHEVIQSHIHLYHSTVTLRWSKPMKSYSHTFINITVLSPQGDPSPQSHTVTHSFVSQHCHLKVIQAHKVIQSHIHLYHSTVTSKWSKPMKSYSHTFIYTTVLSPWSDPSPWSHTVTHSFISQYCHLKVIQAHETIQ